MGTTLTPHEEVQEALEKGNITIGEDLGNSRKRYYSVVNFVEDNKKNAGALTVSDGDGEVTHIRGVAYYCKSISDVKEFLNKFSEGNKYRAEDKSSGVLIKVLY